jgi:hypothetical protein
MGIFGAIDTPQMKMVFCLETTRHILKCDLLLPIVDFYPASDMTSVVDVQQTSRL